MIDENQIEKMMKPVNIYQKFDEWISGEKKEKLVLSNGIISIIIKYRTLSVERLEVKIYFDDDEMFFYTVILNSAISADYFFGEVVISINQYIDAKADIARRVKKFICSGDENELC